MCLAIPGRIVDITTENGAILATADFAGEQRRVCLNFLPDLAVGDYVIVHAGYALSRVDEAQVTQVMQSMHDAGLLDEADIHDHGLSTGGVLA